MSQITQNMLKSICPNLFLDRAASLAALINQLGPKYKIDTNDRLHEFIGQIAHESGEFSIKTENMNYTTPAVIARTWPSRFNLDGSGGKLNANDYVRQPEKLANTVYANRMGNGDFASGEGFHYRGGGFMQLTGKDSYALYAKYIGKSTQEAATLVRTTDQYALDSAMWEFAIDKQLLDEADADDYLTITKRINGGTIGWEERKKYYERAKKFII